MQRGRKGKRRRRVHGLFPWTGVFFMLVCALCSLVYTRVGVRAWAEEGAEAEGWKRSYTTYFNEAEADRRENIAIAARLIDGITLQAYGEFSFNQTVGRRTAEAGFKQAKIIVNGEYVLGVGGGVCQVSTTLYNAALLSGLQVGECHPHSLRVGYVPPSRDAMVSTQSDLTLFNPYDYPVRLQAYLFQGGIRITFLGRGTIDRYAVVSHTLQEISPPPPIVKEGEKEEIVRAPKNGLKSEAYLERYKGDRLVERKRLRVDEYKPVQGIIVKKNENPPDELTTKAVQTIVFSRRKWYNDRV